MFQKIVWEYIGKFGNYLVTFLISIVLTRLLSVEQYGIMAMALVVTFIAGIFAEMGFNQAIIQQPVISSIQLSTVFFINTLAAIFLFLIFFAMAGLVATYFSQPIIKPVLRVLSLSFIINGLNLVPSALIYRNLKLKQNALISISASVVSGVIGIIMAYRGFGVWSLVAQLLVTSTIILICSYKLSGWRPQFAFDIESVKPLWQFGSRMFASGFLERIFTRLDAFIIGRLYQPATLGFYYQAQNIEGIVRNFSAGSIMNSLFPIIARHQHDLVYLQKLFIRYLHIIAFISAGVSAFLFLVARDLFVLLFTQKWAPAASIFQLMMLYGVVAPLSSLMVNMISGMGNSRAFLRLELYKKIILSSVYIFGFWFGLNGFIICIGIAFYCCLVLNMFFLQRHIKIVVPAQIKIIVAYLLVAIVSAFVGWGVLELLSLKILIWRLVLPSIIFPLLYIAICFTCKLPGLEFMQRVFAYFSMVGKQPTAI